MSLDKTPRKCANPSCSEDFVPKSHNQRFHNGDCKRTSENEYYRRSPSVPANFQEPAWPVVKPGPSVKITQPKVKTKKPDSLWRHAVILPDIQIGFYRDKLGNIHPTHDESAISVARQVLRDVNPDQVIIIGDTVDLPEFSLKYRLSPQFIQTTQASIDRVTVLLGELRSDASEAEIVYLQGNHELRSPNYLLDNAKAAFGLRRGCEPEDWPVLSIPYLCRLDEVNVQYLSGYPANVHYINDRLRVIHGAKVSSNSTAHKYLNDERVSTIFGHVHRREWAERTRATRDGSRTILAASPGCLCATDGRVPSTKGGIDEQGVPIISHSEDWQQGIAVVAYQDGDSPFVYENVSIWDGWAMYHGKEYNSITI